MGFASIWIFILRLPWEKEARFFMKHLLDGDAASNTLSWRWIAGIHTNKKPYLVSNENINKLIPNSEILISSEIDKLLNNSKSIDVIYPGIGINLDFIKSFAIKKRIIINYIYREEDLTNWNYADSGFYKFKDLFYLTNNINS